MKNNKIYKKILMCLLSAIISISCLCCFISCENTEDEWQGVFVEEDIVYNLDTLDIWNGSFDYFADKSKTYVKLMKSGDLEVRITPNDSSIGFVNGALKFGALENFDLSGLEVYIKGLFPRDSMKDLKGTVERLGKDLGIYIEGIDYEDEKTIAVLKEISETGKIPSNVILPNGVAFVLKGKYTLAEIHSETQEEDYDAVLLGVTDENKDPYIILTRFDGENGEKCIRIRNEILALDAVASVKEEVEIQ